MGKVEGKIKSGVICKIFSCIPNIYSAIPEFARGVVSFVGAVGLSSTKVWTTASFDAGESDGSSRGCCP